ncbi:tyrosine-type recombinase/integrase [Rhodoferax sp.]|uniref:tyrosine-type recombinase/integrase n=1 Tax=Rhodoferax sp. TaxID=50421 RepID=UPI00274F1DBD|nr:integrase arm-type DNA-binding domain-containing protein [Rhodoferax sp.]
MRGPTNKLTDTKIEGKIKQAQKAAKDGIGKPVLLGDGGGLTLQITKTGSASWLHRYMRRGKPVAVGLGPYPAVSLRMARVKAEACRAQLAEGKDPLSEKRAAETIVHLAAAKDKTFDECAAEYIADHRDEWKNEKHAQQWENTIATYASPKIGARAISGITTADVKGVLTPIWKTKNETATRLRGRIESVIDWATAHEMRSGDNPARWKGHLEHLLAKSTPENRAEVHHAALPYADIPEFMAELTNQEGMSRWALELLILTACRTSEVIGAQWTEVDLVKNIWTVPKERMKAGKEHRVPLVERAIHVLDQVRPFSNGLFLFPGGKKDKPLSNMAMAMLLRRMGYHGITVHGFRSSFRDYVGDETTHDFHTAEAALAHTNVKSKVAAAYARSDLFDKRFAMMRDWEKYCSGASPKAVTESGPICAT